MSSPAQMRLAVELCERVSELLDVPFSFAVDATNAVSLAMAETHYLTRMWQTEVADDVTEA